MTEKKLKISAETIARLVGDVAALSTKIGELETENRRLEAQLTALYATLDHYRQPRIWPLSPVIWSNADAGEQAGVR